MYSDEQIAVLTAAIVRDRVPTAKADPEDGAISIARAVWGAKHHQDFDGEDFVDRIDDPGAAHIAARARACAEKLWEAARLLDEVNALQIDGCNESVSFLGTGPHDLMFGGAATPRLVHEFNRSRRIANRFLELQREHELHVEDYSWPRRAREQARAVRGVMPADFVHKLLDDLAHDMDIAALLHRAVADEYDTKDGGQATDPPLMFASCALSWLDSAGQLPIGKKPSTKRGPASRPDCYELIEDLHGRPLPPGFSRETFIEVLRVLRNEKACDEFRYRFRLQLPKRRVTHEH